MPFFTHLGRISPQNEYHVALLVIDLLYDGIREGFPTLRHMNANAKPASCVNSPHVLAPLEQY